MPAAAGIGGPDRVTGRRPRPPLRRLARCLNVRSGGDRALLVALDFGDGEPDGAAGGARGARRVGGRDVVGIVTGAARRGPMPALFAGNGKVDEIAARRVETGADLVIFDHALSGVQQRNLEQRARMPRRRPHEPHPRHLRAARAQRRRQAAGRARAAASTWRRGSSAAGPTSSGRRAASACAARAKRSSRPTGA